MSSGWYRRAAVWACIAVLVVIVGCHKREHRKVQVHEEQREGPVQEQSPGEMIPE